MGKKLWVIIGFNWFQYNKEIKYVLFIQSDYREEGKKVLDWGSILL